MDDLLGDLLRVYGIPGLFVGLIGLCIYLYATSRAKTSAADAAEKSADATAVAAVSNATTKLIEHLLASLATTTENVRVTTTMLTEILALLRTGTASNAVIATQMEVSSAAQATAAAASTLASTQMDATQTKILEHLEALKTAIDLLTAALKQGDAVDDESREDILKRLATLEQLLKQKTEKAKETQNEDPEPQTTVTLTGQLTSDPIPDGKSGDGAG